MQLRSNRLTRNEDQTSSFSHRVPRGVVQQGGLVCQETNTATSVTLIRERHHTNSFNTNKQVQHKVQTKDVIVASRVEALGTGEMHILFCNPQQTVHMQPTTAPSQDQPEHEDNTKEKDQENFVLNFVETLSN